jgi:RNA polymerase sigma-70 factor (ECF subfamily)
MIENNEIISSEKLCGEIYELCKHISVQQKIVMDILNAEFPLFYIENKEQLRRNNKALSRSAQDIKEERSVHDKPSAPTDISLVKNQHNDPLVMALQDQKIIDGLSYYLKSFTQSIDELQDLVQDCILKSYENRHDRNPSKWTPKTWIYKVAYNTAIDYSRAHKIPLSSVNSNTSDETQDERIDRKSEAYVDGIDDVLVDVERRKIFFKRINILLNTVLASDEKQLLLSLAKWMKYEELAEKRDLPLGTIKGAIFRAREKMRPHLDKLKADLMS